MRRILVPVDGSEYANAAVAEAIKAVKEGPEGELHLLNVQVPIFAAVSLVYLPQDKVDTFYFDTSSKALEEPERLAREAGVPVVSHRVVGSVVDSILAKAQELGCDSIIMGTHGRGKLAEMLLGSVAQRVLLMADIPVTLVKPMRSLDMTGRLGIS